MTLLGRGMAPSNVLEALQDRVAYECDVDFTVLETGGFISILEAITRSRMLEHLSIKMHTLDAFVEALEVRAGAAREKVRRWVLRHIPMNASLHKLQLEDCPEWLTATMTLPS